MNNSSEYLDETKALDPKVQSNINASEAVNEPVRDSLEGVNTPDNEGVPQENKSDFESVDFTCVRGLQENAQYFVKLQEISDLVYNHVRVPFCSDSFRNTVIPKSRAGVPVIPYNFYVTSNGVTGNGATTFSTWMNNTEETAFQDFIVANEPFKVKMDERLKSQLMTKVSIWSNEYLDKGVRDSRARPNAILGDWTWALTPTFSMTTRTIRTDVIACWMYGSYTPTSPNDKMVIINASDLRTFMNTGDGNYWPVEQNTLCLALGKTPTTDLPNLAVLGHSVVIDFDSSMTSARGTLTSYNGLPAYEITLSTTVNVNDAAVARILNNTYSGIDIQWAVFANTLPLPNNSTSSPFGNGSNKFDLRVYENSICDQFINFYSTKRDSGNKLPTSTSTLPFFVQAWRIFKTISVQRTLVELGILGPSANYDTYGKSIDPGNYLNLITGCFEHRLPLSVTAIPSANYSVLWIPYELWIANGANIQLDGETYVDGMSGVLVNTNYLCPRSQVTYSLSDWTNTNLVSSLRLVEYYMPNSTNPAYFISVSNQSKVNFGSCFPSTVPRYSSTSETATMMWNKSQTIDFAYTNTGKIDNTVYRKKLVFNSAVKN